MCIAYIVRCIWTKRVGPTGTGTGGAYVTIDDETGRRGTESQETDGKRERERKKYGPPWYADRRDAILKIYHVSRP